MKSTPEIQFFADACAWRAWLEQHHGSAKEAWVGFRRKDSGLGGITYAEALDEALCFGWIDGIRKKVDATSYTNRFTPRKSGSYWSDVNTRRAQELIKLGRMARAGLAAFAARDSGRTARYSFERASAVFGPEQLRVFRRNKKAWAFFGAQPPSYRKVATWWVISAKQEATRVRRLETLIAKSAAGQRLM
ncbi:MAG: YdeI/OmpD-associated family protein [Opitutaceae bacterium]|nr:YdeI/OmpD-associated family protein [Opitutaceae bacterium]